MLAILSAAPFPDASGHPYRSCSKAEMAPGSPIIPAGITRERIPVVVLPPAVNEVEEITTCASFAN
jgi:hypothetical protein